MKKCGHFLRFIGFRVVQKEENEKGLEMKEMQTFNCGFIRLF